jgi:ribosomal protein S27AE
MSDLICVLGRGVECVATIPEACLCRQMPKVVYLRERHRLEARVPPEPYICPRCGAVSYNPHDKEQRYCGFCHRFEDVP